MLIHVNISSPSKIKQILIKTERIWILMHRSGLTGFHNKAKLKSCNIFLSFTYTHILSPSRMWELAETGSCDAELTVVKCWKHKHEKILIYHSRYFLSCMVLVADFFPLPVILCYNLHSKEYIWNTNLDCLNKGNKEGTLFYPCLPPQTFLPVLSTVCGIWKWEWEYPKLFYVFPVLYSCLEPTGFPLRK